MTSGKILKITCALLLAIFFLLFFTRPIESEDIWWHLSCARWMFENHQFPTQDIFSIKAEKATWMFTQWLGSSIYYLVFLTGKFIGLKLFRTMLFILILGIFAKRAYRKLSFEALVFLLLIMAFGLGTRCLLRPFVFNLLFIQIYLSILINHLKGKSIRRIYLLPFLSILWANIHFGSFIYGTILISTFLLTGLLDWSQLKFSNNISPDELRIQSIKLRNYSIVFLGHLLAFAINPYGLAGAIHPFKAILQPNLAIRGIFFGSIQELQPPAYLLTPQGIWFWFLFTCTLFCLASNKKNSFTYGILFLSSFFLFLYASRASAFFTLVCGNIIIETAPPFISRTTQRRQRICLSILLILLIANILHTFNQKALFSEGFKRKIFLTFSPYTPDHAVRYLKENNIKGNVFNWDGYGGYLLWAAFPDLKPFIDGRQASQPLYLEYLSILRKPDVFFARAQSKYRFSIVLLDATFYRDDKVLEYMVNHPLWQLSFIKGGCIVFVKKDAYTLTQQVQLPENQLSKTEFSKKQILDNKIRVKSKIWSYLADFINPPAFYVEQLEEAVVLYSMGYQNSSMNKIIEVLQETHHPKAIYLYSLISGQN